MGQMTDLNTETSQRTTNMPGIKRQGIRHLQSQPRLRGVRAPPCQLPQALTATSLPSTSLSLPPAPPGAPPVSTCLPPCSKSSRGKCLRTPLFCRRHPLPTEQPRPPPHLCGTPCPHRGCAGQTRGVPGGPGSSPGVGVLCTEPAVGPALWPLTVESLIQMHQRDVANQHLVSCQVVICPHGQTA